MHAYLLARNRIMRTSDQTRLCLFVKSYGLTRKTAPNPPRVHSLCGEQQCRIVQECQN